jgi:hypothetical protein
MEVRMSERSSRLAHWEHAALMKKLAVVEPHEAPPIGATTWPKWTLHEAHSRAA